MKWFSKKYYLRILLISYLSLFLWSGIRPKNYHVWLLEIAGVVFLISIYILFYKRIKFSNITNTWFFIAASLITIGAHYSFPDVPGFDGLSGIFGLERNNFDKLGHVVQGVLPVFISWEVLVKKQVVRNLYWINFLSLNIALAVSAFYELVEWLFIIVFGNNNYTYDVLGTQGYVWDAQSDMLCALIGAILTVILGRKHLQMIIREFYPTPKNSRNIFPLKKSMKKESTYRKIG